jgi:hypothetical protein
MSPPGTPYTPIESRDTFSLLHRWSELYITIHTSLKQFPKRDAHGIGARIETLALSMLEYILMASKKNGASRILILEKLDRDLVQEKILVRLANRIRAMSDSQYITIEKHIVDMGRMTGGWIKSEREKVSTDQ